MNKVLIPIILMLLCSALMANISRFYTFTSGNETYTEIQGTALTSAQGDDVMSAALDIGFPFVYGDSTYTQVKVSSNGFITLGTAPAQSAKNSLDLDTLNICPVIAGLWDDLHTNRSTPVQSAVSYLASGTAGHRKFVVQYKNAYWDYFTDPRNSYIDFQIVLKENNGVEIKFGPNSTSQPGPTAGASIGMNMLPGGTGNFYSVTPGNPATVSTTVENDSIDIHLANGTVYYFNPATQNDMAAISINGPTNPPMSLVSEYTIHIKNMGSVAQTNYSVKLINTLGDLVTVPGDSIAAGDTLDVVIPWTPTTAGVMTISGKVVLDGDANPLNDETQTLTVVVQNTIGTVAGTVKNQMNQPIVGATVTAGTYTATSAASGMYVLHLPMDSYDITATATGYAPQTQAGVFVIAGQTLPLNFILGPVANDDNLEVNATELHSNNPNPFTSSTTLNYEVKGTTPVRIDIYNVKGQLIRTLVNETKTNGHYSQDWDGKDASGKQVSAGVYNYRMNCGKYQSTRHMLLLK